MQDGQRSELVSVAASVRDDAEECTSFSSLAASSGATGMAMAAARSPFH